MFPLFMSGTRKKIWRASLRLRLITLGLAPLLVAFPIILGILTIAGGQIFDKLLITNARGNLASAHTYMEQVRSQTLQNIEEMVRSDRLEQMLGDLAGRAGTVRNNALDQALAARADAARLRRLVDTLPARERALLQLRYGLGGERPATQQQTADKLGISMRTVEVHRAHIFDKMQVKTAVELAGLLK